MSVSAFIKNPIDREEKSFYLPILSESFFNSYWLPASRQLNLYWVSRFSGGIDIYQEDIAEIILEMNQLKTWVMDNLKGSSLEYMVDRIDLFNTHLPIIFIRNDVSVFIG